ncbi:MAG: RIP metalloprotease RseP [Candidatus Hydrogenedentes bacterium]|nr:RIP metalloprotease RseP [Candidatus Hydrogenedentota bacterium]
MTILYDVAIFILVLGELVFFHELGHFLAAKACGIYCERFSLGMPPRLFGFKFGETDYCIGLLPIGGYVKMAGQEDVPLSEDERKEQYGTIPPNRWFMNKPVWQRVIVIFAGPFMNFVLAVVLFAILVGFGAEMPEWKHDQRIGLVEKNSPAASAPMFKVASADEKVDFSRQPDATGWHTGDRIISADGNSIRNIRDFAIEGVLSGGASVLVEIDRTEPDGKVTKYLSPVTPRDLEDDDEKQVRTGIADFRTALIGAVAPDMPAAQAGFKKGDVITALDGAPIDTISFMEAVSKNTDGRTVTATVERDGQKITIPVAPKPVGTFEDIALTIPPDWPDLIDESKPIPVAEEDSTLLGGSGFIKGDDIVSINGEAIQEGIIRKVASRPDTDKLQIVIERKGILGLGDAKQVTLPDVTVAQFIQAITAFDITAKPAVLYITKEVSEKTGLQAKDIIEEIDGKPATWNLLSETQKNRIGEQVTFKVKKPAIALGVMRGESTKDVTVPVTPIGKVGIAFEERKVYYRAPIAQVLPEAFHETERVIKLTIRTLQSLVTGAVSPKELGGPIMIYQITTNTAKFGSAGDLLAITALISVNLAIFNLLPLPVLDGGHLLFLVIEAIRRKPVSAKVMEWVQQAGLVFIIGLMLFVTYNDIGRIIRGLMP